MVFKITEPELKKFRKFLDTGGKKLLLYHNDPDGIASAMLLLKYFPDFETIPRKGPMIRDDFIDELIRKEPKLVIFMDLPVDQESRKINRLLKRTGCRIMILDHHIYEKNMDSRDVLHMNPRFRKKDAYIPAAYMVYRILEKMGLDIKKWCWVAAMGVIGDYTLKDCMDIFKECKKEYPYLLDKEPLKSKLSEASDIISYAVTMKGLKGAGEALKMLMKSLDYDEFMKNKNLQKWKGEMEREFDFVIKDAEKEECPEVGLLIYRIKSRFSLTSLIATHFSEKYPNKIIIVKKVSGDVWKLCLRDQSGRVNLGEMVKKCVKGIGSGGGHEKAAGVMTTDWNRFKKRFISLLKAS